MSTSMREALESAKSWIERWASHVGNCRGGNECACGRTAILAECAAVLSSPGTEELTANISEQAKRVGATFVPSAEKIATYEAAQAARQPEAEPVAWIEFADNGNIRFWTSNPARAWTEGDNGRPLRKFTLAELVALAASPRLDREKVARALCEAAGAPWTSLVSGRPSISNWKEAGLGTQWFWLNLADAIMRETR